MLRTFSKKDTKQTKKKFKAYSFNKKSDDIRFTIDILID